MPVDKRGRGSLIGIPLSFKHLPITRFQSSLSVFGMGSSAAECDAIPIWARRNKTIVIKLMKSDLRT